MTREDMYREEMEALGIWRDVFAPAVRALAEAERDRQRVRRRWIDQGGDPRSDLLDRLAAMDRAILEQRRELGLTPRTMGRVHPETGFPVFPEEPGELVARLQRKHGKEREP